MVVEVGMVVGTVVMALAVAMVETMVVVVEVGCHATKMVVASVVVWTWGLFLIVGGVVMGGGDRESDDGGGFVTGAVMWVLTG